MTEDTELLRHTTGEACPSCEGDVLIVVGGADELHLECDCGAVLALGANGPSLADAA